MKSKSVLHEARLFSWLWKLFIKSWDCRNAGFIETPEALVNSALMETKRSLNTNKSWHHNPQPSTRYPRTLFKRSLMAVLVLYKTLIRHFNWFGRCWQQCRLAEPDYGVRVAVCVEGVSGSVPWVTNVVIVDLLSGLSSWLGRVEGGGSPCGYMRSYRPVHNLRGLWKLKPGGVGLFVLIKGRLSFKMIGLLVCIDYARLVGVMSLRLDMLSWLVLVIREVQRGSL